MVNPDGKPIYQTFVCEEHLLGRDANGRVVSAHGPRRQLVVTYRIMAPNVLLSLPGNASSSSA